MPFSLATYNVLDLFDAPAQTAEAGSSPPGQSASSRLPRAHLDAKLAHLPRGEHTRVVGDVAAQETWTRFEAENVRS